MPINDFRQMDCTKGIRDKTIIDLKTLVRMPTPGFDFITQTLNPKFCSDRLSKQQFENTKFEIMSILDYVCNDYCMVTEITEASNVHYHAWVIFKDSTHKKMYHEIVKANRKFGFCKISKKNNNKSTSDQQKDAYNYLLKDIEETYKFVRSTIIFNKEIQASGTDRRMPLNSQMLDEEIKELDFK